MSSLFRHIKIYLSYLAILICLGQFLHTPVAHAQTAPSASSQCGNLDSLPFTASFQAPVDTYTAYVRLGKTDQHATISLYFTGTQDGICQAIGAPTPVDGEHWQSLGTWQAGAGKNTGEFQLQSADDIGGLEANRPTVMLVSQTNPICTPSTECNVALQGQEGIVRPVGTLKNEESLYVVNAIDPAKDKITRVDYYVDDRPVYSTSAVQAFNLRYVQPGQHVLVRNVLYASGQRVILKDTIDRNFADGLNYYLFSLIYSHKFLIQLLLILVLIFALWYITMTVLRRMYKRRNWKESHGFAKAPLPPTDPSPSVQPAQLSTVHILKDEPRWLRQAHQVLPILGTTVVVLFFITVVNNFMFGIFQVDGVSMQDTLLNNQSLGVNKLGKTWSRLSHNEYVPKRGQIIVFQKATDPYLNPGQITKEFVVKRVIGLPGDRVVMKNGIATVYNQARPDGFQPDATGGWKATAHFSASDQLNPSVNIDVSVQPDELFVMGDNRPESVDSRSYGPIRIDQVVGNVTLRLLPLNKLKLF